MVASPVFWILFGGLAALATVAAALWVYLRKPEIQNHPSTLSSQSRTVLRPLTQAFESLKRSIAADQGSEATLVLGKDALRASEELVAQAGKLARSRDILVEIARRTESAGLDATNVHSSIDQIDTKIHDGTLAIDAMNARITRSMVPDTVPIGEQDEVTELIERLKNMGRSFDEVYQAAQETTQA